MDYKELKTLTDKVVNESKVMEQLRNEKIELEKSSAKVIAGNFDKLFTPEYENWKDIISSLAELVSNYIPATEFTIHTDKANLKIDLRFIGGNFQCVFDCGRYKRRVDEVRGVLGTIIDYGVQYDSYNEVLELFSHFFCNEEQTIKTVDSFRDGIKDLLVQYEEIIGNKSEELRLAIQNLKYGLENFTMLDEKEDGTVTIHLGNKTFVGKLEEAKNE